MTYVTLAADPLRHRERVGIEPQRRTRIRDARISDLIRTRRVEIGIEVGSVAVDRERQAGFETADSAEVPASQHSIQAATDPGSPMTAAPEGQLPRMRNSEGVRAIVVRRPVVLPPIQVVR